MHCEDKIYFQYLDNEYGARHNFVDVKTL